MIDLKEKKKKIQLEGKKCNLNMKEKWKEERLKNKMNCLEK